MNPVTPVTATRTNLTQGPIIWIMVTRRRPGRAAAFPPLTPGARAPPLEEVLAVAAVGLLPGARRVRRRAVASAVAAGAPDGACVPVRDAGRAAAAGGPAGARNDGTGTVRVEAHEPVAALATRWAGVALGLARLRRTADPVVAHVSGRAAACARGAGLAGAAAARGAAAGSAGGARGKGTGHAGAAVSVGGADPVGRDARHGTRALLAAPRAAVAVRGTGDTDGAACSAARVAATGW